MALNKDGFYVTCPFDASWDAYQEAKSLGTIWTNPKRLAWIKRHADNTEALPEQPEG